MTFGYDYRALLGEPGVKHAPMEPYRAPFALSQKFIVTQAYPDHVTHSDAASAYAVDIAMPIGTRVYCRWREGPSSKSRASSSKRRSDS